MELWVQTIIKHYDKKALVEAIVPMRTDYGLDLWEFDDGRMSDTPPPQNWYSKFKNQRTPSLVYTLFRHHDLFVGVFFSTLADGSKCLNFTTVLSKLVNRKEVRDAETLFTCLSMEKTAKQQSFANVAAVFGKVWFVAHAMAHQYHIKTFKFTGTEYTADFYVAMMKNPRIQEVLGMLQWTVTQEKDMFTVTRK